MADIVRDCVARHLPRQGDVIGLASGISHQFDDDGGLRAKMGMEARRLIEREFSAAILMDRFAALYDGIFERRGKVRA